MYKRIKQIRSQLLVFLTHQMALPVLKLIRKEEKFPYTLAELQCFAKGTLGNDLYNFLDNKELELLPYYARHDMKHILLDYDTTDEGEGCLQCFMLGNGHISFPVIATVLYGFSTMPEYWNSFVKAYKKGKSCKPIADWKWFEILTEDTIDCNYSVPKVGIKYKAFKTPLPFLTEVSITDLSTANTFAL